MLSKNNILYITATLLVAYLLFRKKDTNKVIPTGEKKIVQFDPIDVEPMPWIATPDYFKEVK